MKKLYLFFALMFSVVAAWSQFSLPYAYRFDESTVLTDGWATIYDDPYGLGSYFYGVKEETPQNAGCVFTSPHSWAFANLYSESLPADQYLISPQIQNATADSVQLRFWYRVDGYAISENFRVGYCLANSYSDVYDFTWKSGFESVGNTTWQQYVVNLPSNTQYIIINYRYDDNGVALYLDNILIRADQPGLSYPITVNANAGGTVTPGSTVVPEGNSATFNIAADEGYWIRSVSVDGVPVPAAANQTAYTYIFTDVIASHVLTVEFAIREFAIWVTPDYSHGTVTPDGGVTHQVLVPWGHDTTFYFFPDPGYHVSDVYADGYHGVNMNSYTFTNVRESHNLRVVFSLDAYVINASAGTGGTIYPSGQVPVQGLSDQTFSITPDAGYLIDTLYVDGSPWAGVIPTGYSYTFHSVVANHSIAAVFSHQHYLVRWAAQPQGHVTVTGGTSVGQDSVSVFYEDEVVFQITPDEGYQIADVLVNGVSQGNSSPYTLRQVLSETYVQVLFEPVTFDLLVTVNGRGTVVPMSASHVNYFDTVNVALTPASCAQVDSVLLDGNLLGITDVCEITHLSGPHQLSVYFGYIYYGISIVQSAHGTIQGPAEAICDGSAMYQLLPEDCYRVAHFYVDGIQRDDLLMTINDTVVGRLTHLDADHVVTADFEYQYYTVTVSTSGDGTVSNSGSNSVLCGTDLQMVCIPDECSHVSTLTLNGTDVLSQAERRPSGLDGFGDTVILYLQDVRQNFMVYAGFSVTRDTLTVAAGEGGLVSPSGTVLKNCGENSTLTVTPAACHRIQTVYVDGEDRTSDLVMQGNDAQYTFSNLHANHTFYADFELIPYEMDLSASAGGSIIPQGTTSVNCGEDFSFSVVPSSCHQVDSVWVDGVYMRNAMTSLPNADPNTGDTLTYTFHSVNVSHQIRATFAPIRYSVVAVAMGEGTVAGTEIAGYVNCGSPLHFTFTPDDCNALAHVYYNGFEIFDYEMDEYGVGSYDILSLQGPVMLSASFERYSYEVVSSVVGQGMAMYRPSAIDCSDTVKVSFLAAPCHHLDSVRLNGEWYLPQQLQSSGDTLWYVFQNVRANPEVQAVFSIDSVHFIAAAGSFVSVADSTVACGQAVSPYALIPQCHSITSLQVNQQSYSLSDFMEEWPCSLSGDTLFMEFVMNEDLEIGISYVQDQYVLSVSTDGGTTDWEGTHLVTCGDSIAVHVIADDCYQLASVRVNGTPVVLDSEMTLIINPMEQDMDVVILFERMEFTVSTSSNPYGLIYGTSNSYGCGTSPRFEFVPIDCGILDSVWVDDACVNGSLDTLSGRFFYTFNDLHSNHVLRASFVPRFYEVEVTNPEHVVMDVPSVSMVECDSSYQLYFIADECYSVQSVLLDGEPVPFSESVYLNHLTSDHQLTFVYEQFAYTVSSRWIFEQEMLHEESSIVDCGRDTVLWVNAPDCYTIDSIIINGQQKPILDSFEYQDIHQSVYMNVYLHKNRYSIDLQNTEHWFVSAEWLTSVECGEDAHFQIQLEEGYHIVNLVVDGDTLPPAEEYTFYNMHADHTFSVIVEQDVLVIHTNVYGHGNVFPDSAQVIYGSDTVLRIVPDGCNVIDSVFVDGVYVGNDSIVNFHHVVADATVDVHFAWTHYPVFVQQNGAGQISMPDTNDVPCGDDFELLIRPDDCHQVSQLLWNGSSALDSLQRVGDDFVFRIPNVQEIHWIKVEFIPIVYDVTAAAGNGGLVSVTNAHPLCGQDVQVNFIPDDCYEVDSVWVNGDYVGSMNLCSFTGINENKQVEVTFRLMEDTVNVIANAFGTVSVPNENVLSCGETFSMVLTPDDCYFVDSLWVDGDLKTNDLDTTGGQCRFDLEWVIANHQIQVMFSRIMYPVTVSHLFGGTITPQQMEVPCGEDLDFVVAPWECYQIDSVFVNGVQIPLSDLTFEGANAIVHLTDIRDSVELAAHFSGINYSLDVENHGNGSIFLEQSTVDCDGDVTFYVVPAPCEQVSSVFLNNQEITAGLEHHPNMNPLLGDTVFYTLTNLSDDQLISVYYDVQTEHNVEIVFQSQGEVLLQTQQTVPCGGDLQIPLAWDCYTVDSVFVNGDYVGSLNTFTFENILADQSIVAEFVKNSYTVTAQAGVGGSISPTGEVEVLCGESQTFTATPEEGYYVSGWLVDGETQPASAELTLNDVRGTHTVEAQFAQYTYHVSATNGFGGSVSPADTVVAYGSDVTVAITAEECYVVDSVWANGQYVGGVGSYTFVGITADQTLYATFVQVGYTVTAQAGAGGSISPTGEVEVLCGESQTFTATPEEGYYVSGWLVDGETQPASAEFTLNDVRGTHTVEAQFAQYTYHVTATNGFGGNVSPADTVVAYGSDVTVAITAEECYEVDSVWANGQYVGGVGSYTFVGITADQTLYATFVQVGYTVTAQAGVGGSISPTGEVEVLCGESQTFTATPEEGYYVSGWLVDGETQPASAEFTLNDVRGTHTVEVQFAQYTYHVTATNGFGGSVSPADTVVAYGSDVTVAITAEECYEVDSVVVNGVNVGAVDTYTFANIHGDSALTAYFSIMEYVAMASVYLDGDYVYGVLLHIPCGTDTVMEIPMFDCYHLDSVMVNGQHLPLTDSVYLFNVQEDYMITAYMSSNQMYVVASAQGNGTVTPSDTTWVPCNSSLTYTFHPAEGWFTQELIIDGVSLGTPADSTYTFDVVDQNHTIEVIFAVYEYAITSTVDPIDAGQITPYGAHFYPAGDTVTFTIMPFPGYRIVSVEVDGEDVGSVSSYTFENIQDNHTIVAHFSTVGVPESEELQVNIHSSGQTVFVRNESGADIRVVEIFDVTGRRILRTAGSTSDMSFELNVAPGVYVVRLEMGSARISRKVWIEGR